MTNQFVIEIHSFSFHLSGLPVDPSENHGGFVFDCRFLPNPGREPTFKDLTGKDKAVIEYLDKSQEVKKFLHHCYQMIDAAVSNYVERGFNHLMVSFGCTGGRHRSVYCAEQLASHLTEKGHKVILHHDQIEGNPV